MLDLRWPMGLMFAVVGLMMTVYGLVTSVWKPEIYERSLGINVNLWWGLVLIAFSALMLAMAYRAGKQEKK